MNKLNRKQRRVVTANNTNVQCDPDVFKNGLDQYWQHQDIIYDFRSQIDGTGSRSSEVFRVNIV